VRRAGVVAGIVAFAVLAGVLVAHGSGERTAGQSSSGSITSTPAAPATEVDKAQELFAGGKPLEALQTLNGAIQKNPKDVAALTFLGWFTRLTAKQVNHPELLDKAMTYLVRAEEADPAYGPAHLFRGIMLLDDLNQPAAAVPEIQTFLAAPHSPDEQAMVPTAQSTLARAVAAANGGTTSTTVP
jgi:predicted Zn-dependent protease